MKTTPAVLRNNFADESDIVESLTKSKDLFLEMSQVVESLIRFTLIQIV